MILFAFLMSYKELESELKYDFKQVEFFIKGNLAPESEIISQMQAKNVKQLVR